jgi:Beta-1,3-glucanase
MMFSAMRCAILTLLLTVLSAAPGSSQVAPPLLLTFKNESGHAASDVYIGFVGGADATLSAINARTGAALALSKYGTPNWYTLDVLPDGIKLTKFSGRIYVGYGDAWTFGGPGYEPPPSTPNDPNYYLRYDKMEITYAGNTADVANTTSIDYFSIPLALHVYKGGTSGTLMGSVTAAPTNVIMEALGAVTIDRNAAVVTDSTGNFVRVIGATTYPPPPGLPASPYDDFGSYLAYLRYTYAPAHGNILALVKGHFAGVGADPTTPETKPQTYDFPATIDTDENITLTGNGSEAGHHTLFLKRADLMAPTGVYGANPLFSLDGAMPTNPKNDLYGWLIGDLLSGLNIGAVGSTVPASALMLRRVEGEAGLAVSELLVVRAGVGGKVIGELESQEWFKLMSLFSALQPDHKNFYNQWAGALVPISQAYSFAYSDRFPHHTATLNPKAPAFVDTLQIVFLPEHTGP